MTWFGRLGVVVSMPLAAIGGSASSLPVARLPATLGACAMTTIKAVEERLEDEAHRPVPDRRSQVEQADGVMGVAYDQVPAVDKSRRGDRVLTCVADIPRHCPPGGRSWSVVYDDQPAHARILDAARCRTSMRWCLT